MSKYRRKVFSIVAKIPKGKVLSYTEVARFSGMKSSRPVGNILHTNTDPNKVPCHRVVRKDGRLAQGYAMGGIEAQKKRLEKEGVIVKNHKVDMTKYTARIAG